MGERRALLMPVQARMGNTEVPSLAEALSWRLVTSSLSLTRSLTDAEAISRRAVGP